MKSTEQRLQLLKESLLEPNFFQNKGIGNELNFYIFDYDPKDELTVRQEIPKLLSFVEKNRPSIHFQVFDLYEIILYFFEQRGYMEKNFKKEQKVGSEKVIQKMQEGLKIATERDEIIQYIKQHLETDAVVVLTGIGKAFPILRSHIILNSLQSVIQDQSVIMLYPGKFENNTLKLFDIYHDDNYYRAFRIVER
ncbi:DUF1788 domain-containing protein [Jeotgalibaca caeni]|uniref:DUF1788 domain-containing protein n=1 Tax=Jeotgalibaca caeni TaxID=3028623 RepID=UPI00237EDD89|nr:DUF1788 domain-containing protein [Jeotgalibaca caeni]MDE1549167.1 DUF1788 domain-containing protein [Jeotgalibaca caeni]